MAEVKKCNNGYCEIPGGAFQMGSANGNCDEQPVKAVTMTGFELGQTEVSIGDYKNHLGIQTIYGGVDRSLTGLWKRLSQFFTKKTPVLPNFPENQKGDNFPVVGLTFDEKRAYCEAKGGDLPTAAQLYYASRFDDQDSADKLVIWDNGFRSIEPVTAGYQNRFGVYNLLGNVWESSLDAYDPDFYSRMASENPYNPLTNQSEQFEEFTGGSVFDNRWRGRVDVRLVAESSDRYRNFGFRCARPPQDSKK